MRGWRLTEDKDGLPRPHDRARASVTTLSHAQMNEGVQRLRHKSHSTGWTKEPHPQSQSPSGLWMSGRHMGGSSCAHDTCFCLHHQDVTTPHILPGWAAPEDTITTSPLPDFARKLSSPSIQYPAMSPSIQRSNSYVKSSFPSSTAKRRFP
jgi:hypothetical protein